MQPKAPFLLWLEWTGIFVVLPIILSVWGNTLIIFVTLFLATAGTAGWLLFGTDSFNRQQLWYGSDVDAERAQLRQLLLRFLGSAVLLVAFVYFLYPVSFFDFPRQRPLVWVLIMLGYPLLSVYPQELIYRAFFFTRYNRLFPSARLLMLANAATFGLLHIVFHNFLAVALTLAGGWFFANTYATTRSLRLVWLEHSLYGMTIFTIGLGRYFYAFEGL